MRLIMMLALALACSSAVADGALAQRRAAPRDDEDKLPPSVPPPVSTLAPIRGIQGPRLEVGAVLCHSDTDLQHRMEVNRRRIDNVPDAGNPLENCHILTAVSAVEVVEKRGLGRTEVKLKPNGETGWTDSYLK